MSETFSVVVSGQLVDGVSREQVGQNLQKAFKLSPAQVEKLLCGKPVALKRGLDKTAAVKLSERLQKLGAVSMIKANVAAPKAQPVPEPAPEAVPATETVAEREPEPVEEPVEAAPAEPAPVQPAADIEGSEENIECPRCGHEQAFSHCCQLCKMDLTMHIRRMERRARVVENIRKQRQAG